MLKSRRRRSRPGHRRGRAAAAGPRRAGSVAARGRGHVLVGPLHRACGGPRPSRDHGERARRAAGLHVHARRAAPRCARSSGCCSGCAAPAGSTPISSSARCWWMPTARGPRRTRCERLRDALEGVRDQLSVDTWRAFGSTDRAMKALRAIAAAADRRVGQPDAGRHPVASGRDREHDARRRLARDRGGPISRAVAAGVHPAGSDHDRLVGVGVDRAVLGGVLMAAESSVTHRRRFRGSVRAADVLELLLPDPDNPRSIAFSLARLRFHLSKLAGSTGSTRPGAPARAPRGRRRSRRHRGAVGARRRSPAEAGGVPRPKRTRSCTASVMRSCTCTSRPVRCRSRSRRSRSPRSRGYDS